MTQFAIQEQIDATKKVTNKALELKESAQKILIDAGIVKQETKRDEKVTAKEKK